MTTPLHPVQRTAFIVLAVCALGVGAVLIACSVFDCDFSSEPLHTQINPNTATIGQLMTLPGIGPVRAQAIVAYRQQHNPCSGPVFTQPDDLCHVYGLGPAIVQELKPWLCWDESCVK